MHHGPQPNIDQTVHYYGKFESDIFYKSFTSVSLRVQCRSLNLLDETMTTNETTAVVSGSLGSDMRGSALYGPGRQST